MQTVRRNQLVADTIHFALDSPADGLSVQVAVITLLHAKLMQDIHQRLCAPAGINWRVMQKCNFCALPPACSDMRRRPASRAMILASWALVSSNGQPRVPHKA